MKALLLRVGIDKSYGALSPVFADLTYRYIPIYYRERKEIERKETRTYRHLGLHSYLPESLWDKKVHLDPEFQSFTYGDPGRLKRASLLKLSKGDLLVFYIGGKAIETDQSEGCYIIGYFCVETVVNWNELSTQRQATVKMTFTENAHIVSSKSKTDLVLVKGSKQSKQLTHCIPITERNKRGNNPPYLTSSFMQKYLGIRPFIVRAVPIWIDSDKYLRNLKAILSFKD